ncbi:MAG: acyl carrier protein [Candidatus Nanoarchaeia archaeon]
MLEDDVIKIIADQLDVKPSKISLESKFVDDLGADSLDLVELVMTFEDNYGIEISDEDAEKLVYVKDVVEYIRNNAPAYKKVA